MTDAPAAATRGVATTDDLVLTERRGPVALLTLNRPAKLNAWSNALEDRYFDLLAEADDDPQVRAVVVTGAGRGFCSGADLDDLRHVADASDDDLMRPRPRDFPLRVRTPLVAAIRGPVAGLGLVEALYCDVRFGDPTARFTTAFARRGLIAEYGISWLLPRLVGHSRATDLLLSSRMVDADEAHRIGLLDHLVTTGDVVDAAVAYATDLAAHCSPRSMATIKQQLRDDADRSYPDALAAADRLMREAFRGPDVAEGVASHLERRAPAFAALPGSAHAPA
ncbi:MULTISPECIES: enoyl-CoA hydratase-related protein [Rhodococcus]|jgi:enoyl-CoA hydratase/carnithine racemase|uniref:Enoyl-CoA hydratase n=1 Tax=Rhodococcus aetherivorans TaxID=191292 RepID=A0A059MV20_9NOCA|nr:MULTISPECIES: enoyl-CoA hydratase-related protein [Rhodococcus]ETT24592.1 Enoyl-CoA hydratase/isomerase [Rhodococcus rhodochrous ATCC 21198]NCL74203.1 putative enoyl-CoA hydratase echA8 [Rhodococcus sp. YH1]AKE88589.1 enoyl-CoA hydratase [Rhodococcus aetherivorans]KDE14731.1 enoyl-CoA hydratase [Rhodococcus aetherivorans]MBC2591817.1 enoyl-CoA hydratase/isomerase family protein [Rhodococcus aetherivorans]